MSFPCYYNIIVIVCKWVFCVCASWVLLQFLVAISSLQNSCIMHSNYVISVILKKKKKKTFLSLHLPVCKKRTKLRAWPTFGDHALEVNDVGVVELAHDAGLGQEVPPLLVGVAGLQRLDGHADLPLAGHLQAATAHLAELPWKKHTAGLKNVEQWYTSTLTLNCTGY